MTTSRPRPGRAAAPPAVSVAPLVAALQALDAAHAVGDLKAKEYEARKQELLREVGLVRVRARLAPGEAVVAQHHYQQARFPFTGFALRDVADEALSFYATEHALWRWRFPDRPGQRQALLGKRDDLEARAYARLRPPEWRREYRWGEAAVGALMLAVTLLFWSYLAVSGPLLALVGAAGVAHALLWPTPYWLLAATDEREPWRVYAARQRSARELVEAIRKGVEPSPLEG